jgi:hypothetical protein
MKIMLWFKYIFIYFLLSLNVFSTIACFETITNCSIHWVFRYGKLSQNEDIFVVLMIFLSTKQVLHTSNVCQRLDIFDIS